MKIWKNTNTLDGLDEGLDFTTDSDQADCVILGSKPFDIERFPRLKGIFRLGVGANNVPFARAKELGIEVGLPSEVTKAVIYEETANYTCSLIFKSAYRAVGDFKSWYKVPRDFLGSKQLLVIGKGNIGRRVSSKMSAFMRVTPFDLLTNKDEELPLMLSNSDFVSVHIPSSDQNHHFFDAQRLSLMKDGACLINTARGDLIDETALHQELTNGRLFACLDVFSEEPYKGPITNLDRNVVALSPHIASTCCDFLKGCRKDLDVFLESLTVC